jgi:SAM-dependent methyltransferase
VTLSERLLERTPVYRLWQAPFADDKLRPILASNDLTAARRVLDVGCGPGTNTHHFSGSDYVGVDINPRYIEFARRRHGREFVVADLRTWAFPEHERFDFVLLNSFLHHVADAEVEEILRAVARTLAPNGAVHVLDLVLPERPSVARWLARNDRGGHARPLERWRELLESAFEVERFEPYAIARVGVPLWNMVYCKGRGRR